MDEDFEPGQARKGTQAELDRKGLIPVTTYLSDVYLEKLYLIGRALGLGQSATLRYLVASYRMGVPTNEQFKEP